MGSMEKMLAASILGDMMGGGEKRKRELVTLKDEAAQAWREKFQPIPDLKAGDKVRWKTGCKDMDFGSGDENEIFEVFGVVNPPIVPAQDKTFASNHEFDRHDFNIGVWDTEGDRFYPIGCDSRRFERVE